MNKRRILIAAVMLIVATTWWLSSGRPAAKENVPTAAARADASAFPLQAGEQTRESIASHSPAGHSASTNLPSTDPDGLHDGNTAPADRARGAGAGPAPDGQYMRSRLVSNTGKYPLLRIEEHWERAVPPAQDRLLRQTTMVGDHVVVQLRAGYTQDHLAKALQRHGFKLRAALQVPLGFLVAVSDPDPDSVPSMIQALSAEPSVGIVEPDYVYTLNETRPNDPDYASLWGMEKIGMPRVWDTTRGTGGVVVAVFDTGMDLTHPDLASNLWVNPRETPGNLADDDGNGYIDDIHGWDFYRNTGDPSDVDGHGTHVAGTIGGIGGNGIGIAGVGWNIRLLPIKFFGTNSIGQLEGYASDAMAGMYYVIALAVKGVPVRVTNHSWGGGGNSQMLYDAFRLAEQYGILHVAAAGNGGTLNNDLTPHYPASFALSNMLAVANTTSSDGLYWSSHYGAVSVHLGAPGENILSTRMGGGYTSKTGTSMASPHVAGVAALLFDMFPEMTWQEARTLILEGVDPVPALQGKCATGGRLNAGGTFARIPPRIAHEPLQNTDVPYLDFPVAAVIRPGLSFVETAMVLWCTNDGATAFHTNIMQHTGDNRFETTLPGQPKGTAVSYMISVETKTGLTSVHPAGAPAALHSFAVTHPVSLRVFGYPVEAGTVTPAYGDYSAAWGSTVAAEAPAFTEALNGIRWRCAGWSGAGSVPFAGDTNRTTFTLRESSYLLWWWNRQAALTQISDPSGIVETVTWTDTVAAVSTVLAPATAMRQGVEFAFIGWELDGARLPDSASPADNPATAPPAGTPRTAVARYIPSALDADGDGLPDWWELLHFNSLAYSGADDPDGDGYDNASEFADRSCPADGRSIPEGPDILHEPLPAFQETPAPWHIQATVTDRVAVAVAVLRWRRNSGVWNETRMTAVSSLYSAHIPLPASPGDRFEYQLTAEDAAGNASATPLYSFMVRYPLLSFTIGNATTQQVAAGRTALLQVLLTNAGNAVLEWETTGGILEAVSADPGDWTHGGPASQWHVSTRESYSAPYAWFCGDPGGGLYNHSMDASLYTPPVTLGGDPRLRFRHWPEMEYDGRPGYGNYYWDGAVVEISRDGGIQFENIAPVGGYPFRITPNTASPFEAHRPCLGGHTGGWHAVEFDLAAYAGETVQVRFRFGTDRYVEARGWFIDDIEFTWSDTWLEAPSAGTVPAGGSSVVELRLNASALAPGTYRGAWTARSNAPGTPVFAVPVTLQVNAPPHEASMRLNADDPAIFVLTWASQTGRIYSLSSKTGLTEDAGWTGVTGFTNLPGVAGSMSYTGTLETTPMKFFRIEEQAP